jgi:osmotically-inducible protein OsmY
MNKRHALALHSRPAPRAAAVSLCLAAGLAACVGTPPHALLESPADAEISAQVQALFAQSPALDAPNLISVQTHAGVIYLRGLVSTPYQIEAAGSLAARAAGVERVENLLSTDNAR